MRLVSCAFAAAAGPLLASASPLAPRSLPVPHSTFDDGFIYYRLTERGPAFLIDTHDKIEEQTEYCHDDKCGKFNPAKPTEDMLKDKALSFVTETVDHDTWEVQRTHTRLHHDRCVNEIATSDKCEVGYGMSGQPYYDPREGQIAAVKWNAGPGHQDGYVFAKTDWSGETISGGRCLVGSGSGMRITDIADGMLEDIEQGSWAGSECNFYHRIPSNAPK